MPLTHAELNAMSRERRLAEIEAELASVEAMMYVGGMDYPESDMRWLVERVKELEAALANRDRR